MNKKYFPLLFLGNREKIKGIALECNEGIGKNGLV